MTSAPSLPDFVVTREYQRFVEFCEACRQYRYIGLCYGPPGVGKTLSARYYTHWEKVEAFRPYGQSSAAALQEVLQSNTVFYTVPVVISPKELAREVMAGRNKLHSIRLEPLHREEAKSASSCKSASRSAAPLSFLTGIGSPSRRRNRSSHLLPILPACTTTSAAKRQIPRV